MQLSRDDTNGYVVTAFDDQSISVNDKPVHSSLWLSAEQLVPLAKVDNLADVSAELLQSIAAHGIEVLLIGTGQQQQFLAPKLTADLARQHIGVESMDTAAACRTYNVLLAEQRRVAALLIVERD